LITRNVPHDRLEELPVPLHVAACDVLSGAEVLLSRGPLAEAVLASAAIPGVLPAVDWEGRLLIDGGVVDNTPLSHAVALGAREIYVLPTGAPASSRPRPGAHSRWSCTPPGSWSRSASPPKWPRSPGERTS
jgi:NTE family protein